MLTNHAKLMQFFAVANEVTGRKKLQKMIYILQKCKLPFEEKYQFHFYGPYSEELSLRIQELCNLGFLKEEKEDKSNYSQYKYTVTEDGQEFLSQFDLDMPDMHERVGILQEKSSRFLELVSTVIYFSEFSKEEVVEKVRSVKPKQKYTGEEFAEAFRFIDNMHPSRRDYV